MNDFAKMILDRVATWPDAALAELLAAVDDIEAKHVGVYHLSAEERAAVKEGLAQAERGEFASDEQVAAFYNQHR